MKVETEARQLLEGAGLAPRGPLVDRAATYLRRTRLGRRYGLIGGLMLGFGPLSGDSRINLVLPRMLAGYMLGLLVSEWLVPRGARPARRAADLRVRQAADLIPGWARVLVWILFVPTLAAPLLVLVHPVRGLTNVSTDGYRCSTWAPQWPGLPTLAAAAAIGAAGLLVTELTLARLARRPRPADDLDRARLDDVLRGMSARAVAGGAAALALTLAAAIASVVANAAIATLCTPAGRITPAFPWAAALTPWLRLTPLVLAVAAFVVLAVCRRRPDPRHRIVPGLAP
jgi:hypothetical protein